ncbi:hypothetical protein FRB95_012327 [Tulasnella sp. JGI-2019a]|nr:hypothetical protein FRB95_012327 [Tulasnella sp. JGI-2019a]
MLIIGISGKYLNEAVLAQLLSHLPGGAKAIWLNRSVEGMPKVYNRRVRACNKLESAERIAWPGRRVAPEEGRRSDWRLQTRLELTFGQTARPKGSMTGPILSVQRESGQRRLGEAEDHGETTVLDAARSATKGRRFA